MIFTDENCLRNCDRWLANFFSVEPADRSHAQSAVKDLYIAAGLKPPRYVFWFDSPFDARWANTVLSCPDSFVWQRLLPGLEQVKAYRETLDHARKALCQIAAEENWGALLAAVGPPLGRARKSLNKGASYRYS